MPVPIRLAACHRVVVGLAATCFASQLALATVTTFFSAGQIAVPVSSAVTSDTIRSNGYQFTYTRDKLFTGGTGSIIGRAERIHWPTGVEAQAVTTPPPGVTNYSAAITLKRVDGKPFDLTSFTAKLLANTAGAGGSIEIMPLLNGNDGFNDPIAFDVTGNYNQTFSYSTAPNPWGSTALLKGFDTYNISLYVDFAFTALSLQDPSIAGDFNNDQLLDPSDIDLLFAATPGAVTASNVKFDVTGDSQVIKTPNVANSDADFWVRTLMATEYGDFNLDSLVNFDDLLVLAQNYGTTAGATWANGNANGDGAINFDDLLVIAQNYVPGALGASDQFSPAFTADWQLAQSMVPEPTALAGLSLGVLLLCRKR